MANRACHWLVSEAASSRFEDASPHPSHRVDEDSFRTCPIQARDAGAAQRSNYLMAIMHLGKSAAMRGEQPEAAK